MVLTFAGVILMFFSWGTMLVLKVIFAQGFFLSLLLFTLQALFLSCPTWPGGNALFLHSRNAADKLDQLLQSQLTITRLTASLLAFDNDLTALRNAVVSEPK